MVLGSPKAPVSQAMLALSQAPRSWDCPVQWEKAGWREFSRTTTGVESFSPRTVGSLKPHRNYAATLWKQRGSVTCIQRSES